MNYLRKETFLLPFFCASMAYAASSTETSVIPPLKKGFGVSAGGLILQPNANNLTYAVYTTPLPLPAPNWYQQTVKPDYAGAFTVGLQYNLPDLTNQLKLDWLHFNHTDYASYAVTEPNTSVGAPFYYGPAEQFLSNTTANSTVKFNVDHVNLIASHFINMNHIRLEPIFGMSSAYLKENISNNYTGTDPVFGAYTHRMQTNSSYTGFGPRIGLGIQYFVNSHFGMNMGLGSSLFVGSLVSSTNFSSWTGYVNSNVPSNNTLTDTTLSNQRQTVVVPEIDGKLGFFYRNNLNQNTMFTIQIGYMFQDYINSVYQVQPSTLVPLTWEAGTVAIVNQTRNQSDISLNGPYIKVVLS